MCVVIENENVMDVERGSEVNLCVDGSKVDTGFAEENMGIENFFCVKKVVVGSKTVIVGSKEITCLVEVLIVMMMGEVEVERFDGKREAIFCEEEITEMDREAVMGGGIGSEWVACVQVGIGMV